MPNTNIETIRLSLAHDRGFTLADREARGAVPEVSSDLLLVGWWDRDRATGGPVDVCGDEDHACVAAYAQSHGASYRVLVDDGAYEFFYATTPSGTETLDASAVIDVHSSLRLDEHENVQGG